MQIDGVGDIMIKKEKKGKYENYPSLYDAFALGDRVKRYYKDKNGMNKEYKGIILAIDKKSIEIYWDTLDGKYRPNDMHIGFTNCPVIEIFNGSEDYTPIEKED